MQVPKELSSHSKVSIMREVNAVISTSNASLLQLYTDNRTALTRFSNSLTRSHSDAEDIVQDAFFRLSSARPVTPKAQLSYLFQIVRNLSIDHYRKQSQVKKRHGGSDVDTILGNSSPEASYSDTQTLNQINAALAELPKRTRYAFERHRLHGISQKEIAIELNVSNTLVHFMIRDALLHCNKSVNIE